MANITKCTNGTYLVRVCLGLDENGKPIQRSKTFHPSSLTLSESKKQKELEHFIFEFENEVKFSGDIIRSCPHEYTFAEFVRKYLQTKGKMLAPGTLAFYERVLNTFCLPRIGKMKLTEMQPIHVQQMIATLMKPGIRSDGRGDTSRRQPSAVISRFCNPS